MLTDKDKKWPQERFDLLANSLSGIDLRLDTKDVLEDVKKRLLVLEQRQVLRDLADQHKPTNEDLRCEYPRRFPFTQDLNDLDPTEGEEPKKST